MVGQSNESAVDLATSIASDTKDNHFDQAIADEAKGKADGDFNLNEEDVDDSMFIFPDRAGEEEKQLEVPQL